MSAIGTSRHFAALRNLVAIGTMGYALHTAWVKADFVNDRLWRENRIGFCPEAKAAMSLTGIDGFGSGQPTPSRGMRICRAPATAMQ